MRASLIDAMRNAAGQGLGIIRNQSGITAARLVFSDIVDKLSAAHHLHPADQDILQMGILGQAYVRCRGAAPRKPRGTVPRGCIDTDTQWAKWQIVTQSADGRYIWTERLMG